MRKLTAALLAAALIVPAAAAPALAKDNHGKHQGKAWAKGHDKKAKAWAKGQRFDRRYAPNYRVISYREYNRLYAPPRGYRWVRSDRDAVLVGITSGVIQAVLPGLF